MELRGIIISNFKKVGVSLNTQLQTFRKITRIDLQSILNDSELLCKATSNLYISIDQIILLIDLPKKVVIMKNQYFCSFVAHWLLNYLYYWIISELNTFDCKLNWILKPLILAFSMLEKLNTAELKILNSFHSRRI